MRGQTEMTGQTDLELCSPDPSPSCRQRQVSYQVFARYMHNKESMCTVYKELTKLNRKTKNSATTALPQIDIPINGLQVMTICSASLIIREV